MREISFSILVLGILFIRKAAWGKISRRLQYALWLLPFCYLLISPVWSVPSSFSIENGISHLAGQWKETEADSMGTPEVEVLSVLLGKVQGKQEGVDRQDSVAGQVGNGRQDATGRQEDTTKVDGADKVVTDNLDSVDNQTGNDRQDSSDKQETGKGIADREDYGKVGWQRKGNLGKCFPIFGMEEPSEFFCGCLQPMYGLEFVAGNSESTGDGTGKVD